MISPEPGSGVASTADQAGPSTHPTDRREAQPSGGLLHEPSYRGVRKVLNKSEWRAHVYLPNGQRIPAGSHATRDAAAREHDRVLTEMLGSVSPHMLNFPTGGGASGSQGELGKEECAGSGPDTAQPPPEESVPRPARPLPTTAARPTGTMTPSGLFRGVYYSKPTRTWHAQVAEGDKVVCVGRYPTEVQAARAFDAVMVRVNGQDACSNFAVESYEEDLMYWRRHNQGAEIGATAPLNTTDGNQPQNTAAQDVEAARRPDGSAAPAGQGDGVIGQGPKFTIVDNSASTKAKLSSATTGGTIRGLHSGNLPPPSFRHTGRSVDGVVQSVRPMPQPPPPRGAASSDGKKVRPLPPPRHSRSSGGTNRRDRPTTTAPSSMRSLVRNAGPGLLAQTARSPGQMLLEEPGLEQGNEPRAMLPPQRTTNSLRDIVKDMVPEPSTEPSSSGATTSTGKRRKMKQPSKTRIP